MKTKSNNEILTPRSEPETGNSTFLNWQQMVFGENGTPISPSLLTGDFNSLFEHKNIIMIDEAVLGKSAEWFLQRKFQLTTNENKNN